MKDNLRSLKAMTKLMNPEGVKNQIFNGVKMPYKRSRETKPRKAYKHDEQDLSRLIQDDLKLAEFHQEIVHFDRYNSGMIQSAIGHWIKLCRKGTADIMFMLKDRHCIYIETKAKTGQSKEQKEFQKKVEIAGHKYYIVDSLEKWNKIRNEHIIFNEI